MGSSPISSTFAISVEIASTWQFCEGGRAERYGRSVGPIARPKVIRDLGSQRHAPANDDEQHTDKNAATAVARHWRAAAQRNHGVRRSGKG